MNLHNFCKLGNDCYDIFMDSFSVYLHNFCKIGNDCLKL